MINFGLKMGRGKNLPPPYIAKIRVEVRGKLSSYTRGGQFRMYPTTGATALDEGVDFGLTEKSGITYSDANLKIFLDGGNPSSEIVTTNGSGFMELSFPANTLFTMDRVTIQGRTTAASTYFRMVIYDNHGHILWSRGSQSVKDMETWAVGIALASTYVVDDLGNQVVDDNDNEVIV